MHIPKIQTLYLVLDQGGHASRAFVFDTEGCVIARASENIATQHPQPTWVEHDAETLVASLQSVIHEVVTQLSHQSRGICAAGLATQRASIVSWHRESGQALSKVITWQDRRAADWMQTFSAQVANIHKTTGLFPSAHYGASKLRWSLDHLPQVQQAQKQGTLCFGPLASFLSARLTQTRRALSDPANAARTLLWNIKTKDWDTALLQAFGIPLQALPLCVASRFDFGRISVSGFEIPLVLVTGDQSAALFQEGPPQKNTIYINIGTGAFLQRIFEDKIPEAPRLLSSLVFSDKNHQQYALEGTVNGAGAALAWFAKQNHTDDPWPKEAESWLRDTVTPPLFINGIGGVGSPFWLPNTRSYFIGDGNTATRFTALVESILFLIKANLDEMCKISGLPETLRLSGGLSTSEWLCQKLADLSEIPVLQSTQQEATAQGLAYLLGQFPESRHTASKKFIPRPVPKLRQRYSLWLKAMHALQDGLNP